MDVIFPIKKHLALGTQDVITPNLQVQPSKICRKSKNLNF